MSWTVKAPQLGSATQITCTVVLGGEIYGGTNLGTLLKWDGVSAWTQVAAATGGFGRVFSMVVSGGLIYAALGTGIAEAVASSAGGVWTVINSINETKQLVTYAGGVYGISGLADSAISTAVYRYLPSGLLLDNSRAVGTCTCAVEFGGLIWACLSGGLIGTNNGVSSLTTVTTLTGQYGTSICSHAAELYVGTSIGNLYKWTGAAFALQASVGSAVPITSLISFNSKLYAGLSQP